MLYLTYHNGTFMERHLEKCSDDDHPKSLFLVRDWDHDRNDYRLDYLAGDIRIVDDSGVDGIVCIVRIGAAVGARSILIE